MKDFAEFLKEHKDKIYECAQKNTKYNKDGDAVISRDDPWFYEDCWDDYYESLMKEDDRNESQKR